MNALFGWVTSNRRARQTERHRVGVSLIKTNPKPMKGMNHWHSFISFNHWNIRNWYLFKFSYLGGFLDTHRPINSLSRVINKKKSNSTVYSTASATPPICLAGKICVTFHYTKFFFPFYFSFQFYIENYDILKNAGKLRIAFISLKMTILTHNHFTLLDLSSCLLTCLVVMNYIVHIKLNWDSQQGRLRTTSILVWAFWNFKLKVPKYSRSCGLQYTFIPWSLKKCDAP